MVERGDTILVLGGTSLVGRFLLPMLAAEGPVTALSRAPRPAIDGVRWVAGDLTKPETLAAIGRVDQVYSLSPIWLLPEALDALGGLGMKRLVAFSSTSVLTKAHSTSAYERQVVAKLQAGEAAVEAYAATRDLGHALGYTLLRPTLIYAEGQDANVSRLAAMIRRFRVMPLPGGGVGLRQPVHAQDLATLAKLAMERPAANRAYAAPGGETLTYRAMVERIYEGLGLHPVLLPLPRWLADLTLPLASHILPPTTAQMIARINDDLAFDGTEVERDFGWKGRAFRPGF